MRPKQRDAHKIKGSRAPRAREHIHNKQVLASYAADVRDNGVCNNDSEFGPLDLKTNGHHRISHAARRDAAGRAMHHVGGMQQDWQ